MQMKSENYPLLYRSASDLSRNSQRHFFFFLGSNLVLLVSSSFTNELIEDKRLASLLLLTQLLCSLGCAVALLLWRHQQVWYQARALSESVKTMTWRFMMNAEPYNNDQAADTRSFVENLQKILEDNRSLPFKALGGEQIVDFMNEIRKRTWKDRKSFYEVSRINEQQTWYRNKSNWNEKKSKVWYAFVILLHAIALCLLAIGIADTIVKMWWVSVVLALASSAMAWLQAKRFQELAASYALTMHDITLLKTALAQIKSEKELSAYVGDAENAFSREHTQWRARRDVA
jgi:SMODS and SLOG-associating 2TM effector domain 1/SMODS and SLOG-associating 2TM effector domain 3